MKKGKNGGAKATAVKTRLKFGGFEVMPLDKAYKAGKPKTVKKATATAKKGSKK